MIINHSLSAGRRVRPFVLVGGPVLAWAAVHHAGAFATPASNESARCTELNETALAVALGVKVELAKPVVEAGTWEGKPLPQHCTVRGAINPRRSDVDGREYAIRFVMRMPLGAAWNGRFLQLGGGGSNGATPTALDPILGGGPTPLQRGFAVIDTDGGHDDRDIDPAAGGAAAFGRDPQARRDHFANAYDQVARAGKWLATHVYGRPMRSYFIGCSEGGREAMLMSQRFPERFDGIAAGAPQFRQPMQSLSSIHGIQLIAAEARRAGLMDPAGMPAIHKLFSDGDLRLAADAIADACDASDGLRDRMISRYGQCRNKAVRKALAARKCGNLKTDRCLMGGQIDVLEGLHAPTRNAAGEELYPGYPWDTGIIARSSGFRAWWLGAYDAPRPTAVKLLFSPSMLRMVWTNPPQPFDVAQSAALSLAFDYARYPSDPAQAFPSPTGAADAAGVQMVNDSIDLDAFERHGGKLLIWAGAADATHSLYQTTRYMDRLRERYGKRTRDVARLFVAPAVAHCQGGPGTDQFDLLDPLIRWVEQGKAPSSILATTSPKEAPVPLARPMCAYPAYARYRGGPTHRASSFVCSSN